MHVLVKGFIPYLCGGLSQKKKARTRQSEISPLELISISYLSLGRMRGELIFDVL